MAAPSASDIDPGLPAGRRMNKRALGEILLSGFGFACGLGWLWFGALQSVLLPTFLWGATWSGGGASLFLMLLLVGLFFTCLLAGKLSRLGSLPADDDLPGAAAPLAVDPAVKDFRSSDFPHLIHGFTLFFLATAFFPWPVQGVFLYVPVVCVALGGLLQGLFWGAAILRLNRIRASWAMAWASATAVCLSLGCSRLSMGLRPWLMFALVLLAWWAAWKLGALLRAPRRGPKRSRGRPAKREEKAPVPALEAVSWQGGLLWICPAAAASVALAALNEAGVTALPLPVWLVGCLSAVGATLGALLIQAGERALAPGAAEEPAARLRPVIVPFVLLCAGLAVQGLLRFWQQEFVYALLPILHGLYWVAVVALFSGADNARAMRRASLCLLAVLLLSNLGSGAFVWLDRLAHLLDPDLEPSRLGGLIQMAAAALFGLPLLAARLRGKKIPEAGAEPRAVENTEQALAPGSALLLTAREEEILLLASQGLSNKQIAARLHVQETTVRFHLRNIYQKTGLKDRSGLQDLSRQGTKQA